MAPPLLRTEFSQMRPALFHVCALTSHFWDCAHSIHWMNDGPVTEQQKLLTALALKTCLQNITDIQDAKQHFTPTFETLLTKLQNGSISVIDESDPLTDINTFFLETATEATYPHMENVLDRILPQRSSLCTEIMLSLVFQTDSPFDPVYLPSCLTGINPGFLRAVYTPSALKKIRYPQNSTLQQRAILLCSHHLYTNPLLQKNSPSLLLQQEFQKVHSLSVHRFGHAFTAEILSKK